MHDRRRHVPISRIVAHSKTAALQALAPQPLVSHSPARCFIPAPTTASYSPPPSKPSHQELDGLQAAVVDRKVQGGARSAVQPRAVPALAGGLEAAEGRHVTQPQCVHVLQSLEFGRQVRIKSRSEVQ